MNEQQVGLLGATSLVGECLLQQLIQNHCHITAFSRQHVTQIHPQITWQQLNTINPGKVGAKKKSLFGYALLQSGHYLSISISY